VREGAVIRTRAQARLGGGRGIAGSTLPRCRPPARTIGSVHRSSTVAYNGHTEWRGADGFVEAERCPRSNTLGGPGQK